MKFLGFKLVRPGAFKVLREETMQDFDVSLVKVVNCNYVTGVSKKLCVQLQAFPYPFRNRAEVCTLQLCSYIVDT